MIIHVNRRAIMTNCRHDNTMCFGRFLLSSTDNKLAEDIQDAIDMGPEATMCRKCGVVAVGHEAVLAQRVSRVEGPITACYYCRSADEAKFDEVHINLPAESSTSLQCRYGTIPWCQQCMVHDA